MAVSIATIAATYVPACSAWNPPFLTHPQPDDESKTAVWADPVTGAAPLVWDRAVGWYLVSLTETIQCMPTSHAGYAKLVGYFQTLAAGVLGAQDAATGGWRLIMDAQYADAEANYIESSASAMFTYGFLLGVRLGLLDAATYLPAARTAYEMLVRDFVVEVDDGLDWEGTVSVGSLGSNATFEVSRTLLFIFFRILRDFVADDVLSTTLELRRLRTTTRASGLSCGRRMSMRCCEMISKVSSNGQDRITTGIGHVLRILTV